MKKLILSCILVVITFLMMGCDKITQVSDELTMISYAEGDGSYQLENEGYKLVLDPETTYFAVTDKSTGYVWHSNPVDGSNDPLADPLSKKYLQSTFLVEYASDNGIYATYSNFDMSIMKKTYEIQGTSDEIKVHYLVGDTKKEYRFPTAIPASRMDLYMDKMEKSQKRKIDNYYRKYEIDKLRATDNKDELLGLYPDLANEAVYVLREGQQEYLKEKIETMFTEIGYTDEDFAADKAIYGHEKEEDIPLFEVTVVYKLEESGLVVTVPFQDLKWKMAYPMTKLHLLPYLGAGDTKDSGYLMVPEGTGAIIDFNNGKKDQSAYYTQVYGWDEGVTREEIVTENSAMFPAYGIGRSGASLLCVLGDYASLAEIRGDVSGRSHSYNYAYATYTTLHSDAMEVSSKTDKSVMVYESKKPEGAIVQHYLFLDTESYSDMALAYGDYLLANYPNLGKNQLGDNVPLNINLVGAIDDIKQILGFPKSMPKAVTDFKEANEMLNTLADYGYGDLSLQYLGWMNGGIKQKYIKDIDTVDELGKEKELKAVIQNAKDKKISLYLNGFSEYAFSHSFTDDLTISKDVSKFASAEVVKLKPFSFVYFGEERGSDTYYLLRPQTASAYTKAISNRIMDLGGTGMGLMDIGSKLSGDYNPKNLVTREASKNLQRQALDEVINQGIQVAVNGGNDYMLDKATLITDMNLTGEPFQIIDYNIPFYSMALHGLVRYTGEPLNLSNDYKRSLLKNIENGCGLNYTLMAAEAAVLQETDYTEYFAADASRWLDQIATDYKRYNDALGKTVSQKIEQHTKLAKDVYQITYEDGTQVTINYGLNPYQQGDIQIGTMDYYVEEVTP